MSMQRLFLLILILALGCRNVSAERSNAGITTETNEESSIQANANENVTESNVEEAPEEISNMQKEQIELNRTALLTFSDKAGRINAASLLLLNQNPYAKEVLINTLNSSENRLARMAICDALIQHKDISNKNDFIEPLLNIFSTNDIEEAKLVADTMLIYPYRNISPLLKEIVTNPQQPAKTRINVIASLKKVWEKDAIISLYRLVDDPNEKVATEAGNALNSLGFQVGSNNQDREKIISDIQNKEIVELQKDLLVNQDKQIRARKDEFEQLKNFTLSVLEDAYLGADDASKGKFLSKYLGDTRTWVKSWALDKVRSMRMAGGTSIPSELEPAIIKLISDPSEEIRLATIGLIGFMQTMQTVDLTTPLLTQYEIEMNEQVKIEMLDILGIVCSTTHKPDSKTKITLDIKQKVLGYASDFLLKDDNGKAKIGAKVMRKLIEKDGLQEQEVKKYLTQIADKYVQKKDDPNNTLKAELLDTMVGLSAENSISRQHAREAFSSFFEDALNDGSEYIRASAIDGLGYIDKTNALKLLRNLVGNEQSENVRLKIIEFARDAGGSNDLVWLEQLIIGTNPESKQAWTAMLRIFESVEIDILNNWENQLIAQESKYNLSEQQKIDFLKIVLTKTPAQYKPKYYEQIADRYYKTGQYEQAVNNFTYLYDAAETQEQKDKISPNYLDACLRIPNENLVKKLVMDYLTDNEFKSDNPLIETIENYFKDPKVITDKNIILKSLRGIVLTQTNAAWQSKLQEWNDLLNKPEPEIPVTPTETP